MSIFKSGELGTHIELLYLLKSNKIEIFSVMIKPLFNGGLSLMILEVILGKLVDLNSIT